MPTRRRNKSGRRLWRGLVAIALLHLLSSGWTQSFQFFLRNGDRVTGIVVTEDAERVTITNAAFGKFSLPLAQIERREPVPAAGAPAATARKPGNGVPATAIVNPAVPKPGAPPGSAPPKPARHLGGEVLAGTDVAFSTKDRQLYTGRVKLNYTAVPLRNALDYLFTYGKTDGELSANRMDGSLKTDYDLTRRSYVYNLGTGGYDEIRKIDSYFQVGPGLGYHLFKLTNFVASAETGANYQEQNFSDGRKTDSIYYRFAEQFKWTINAKFSLDQKVEYFPQWNDTGEYKIRFEANLRYWLRANLSLNLTIIDLYDTRAAAGIEPNDLQIRSSIGVKF